jgi:transcriptional regulator
MEPAVAKPRRPTSRIELLQGTLDFLILQALQWGPRHGYGIALMIRAASQSALKVDAGSLYPALYRLERQGEIDAEESTSERNQRVRIYRITAKGRKRLAAERSRWQQFIDVVAALGVRPTESDA